MRVTLNGYVVLDEDAWLYRFFGYDVIAPADVRQALADNPQGETLTLEINSGGGSVWAGFEIYSVLMSSEVHTVAEVQSLAASAASTLMLGCDEVWLSPVAQVMIHNPIMGTEGNTDAHRESIRVLESITESILNAYQLKCQGHSTREELRAMMQNSTWMSAQAALEAGLADGILWAEAQELLPANIVNAVGGGIRAIANSGGLPDITQLRARYEAEHKDPSGAPGEPGVPMEEGQPQEDPAPQASTGGEPEANTQNWQAQARLDLEKNRFMEEKEHET